MDTLEQIAMLACLVGSCWILRGLLKTLHKIRPVEDQQPVSKSAPHMHKITDEMVRLTIKALWAAGLVDGDEEPWVIEQGARLLLQEFMTWSLARFEGQGVTLRADVRIVDMGEGVPIMPRVELTDGERERERLAELIVVKLMEALKKE